MGFFSDILRYLIYCCVPIWWYIKVVKKKSLFACQDVCSSVPRISNKYASEVTCFALSCLTESTLTNFIIMCQCGSINTGSVHVHTFILRELVVSTVSEVTPISPRSNDCANAANQFMERCTLYVFMASNCVFRHISPAILNMQESISALKCWDRLVSVTLLVQVGGTKISKKRPFICVEQYLLSSERKYILVRFWSYISCQESQTVLGCHHMCSAAQLPYRLFYTACIRRQILRAHISSLIFDIKQISCEAYQFDRASPPHFHPLFSVSFSRFLSPSA